MNQSLKAGSAGLLMISLAVAFAAPAVAAPSVTVRVEGESSTLLSRSPVTPPDAPEPNTGCAADSAANALNTAVAGNWDGEQFTSTILGESHTFANNDYWSFWVFRGGRFQVTNGICDERLSTGEELLAAVQIADPDTFAPTLFPLWLEGVPATIAPGAPVTVTVAQTTCGDCLPGEGTRVVRAGATVTAGSVTATTDAQGRATLTLGGGGPATLRATAPGALPSAAESACVTNGADGFCGTTAAAPGAPMPSTPSPPVDTRDRRAPEASVVGIAEQQRFTRRRAPRELAGTVDEASLHTVKIGLSRRHRGRCWTFSGKRERFRRSRCGHHAMFRVGDRPDWSYLLPKRLGRGRYVLDVIAVDAAFNRDRLARGRNRIVFHVR